MWSFNLTLSISDHRMGLEHTAMDCEPHARGDNKGENIKKRRCQQNYRANTVNSDKGGKNQVQVGQQFGALKQPTI